MSARRFFALLLPVALAACATAPQASSTAAPAVAGPVTGAFVTTLGSDTLSVERYTRTATSLIGDIVNRQPTVTYLHYEMPLDAAGRPTGLTYGVRRADGTFPPNAPRNISMTMRADSAFIEIQRDTMVRRALAAPAGVMPWIGGSYAMWEVAAKVARASGDSSAVMLLGPNAQRPATSTVVFYGGDSARLWSNNAPVAVKISADGRILGADGKATTQKVIVRRVATADINTIGAGFYAAEQAGQRMAQTTRDTVNAQVGAAKVWIDYGRPVRRGREILGGVVPFDSVWRTGANGATQLRTDRDLMIGETLVPAGTYTLFTFPTRAGTTLIVNKQVGQWGTAYDSRQDFARIPMQTATAGASVERFTIAIEPQGSATAL